MSKGGVFIVSGPSGSGKDTVLAEVFKLNPDIEFSISSITRPMREENEINKYNFLTREAFEEMIANDMLLEHNIYVGNYYGTPREPVEKAVSGGKNIIIEVDVNGARQIKNKLPDAVSIFIMPPSFEELKRRLTGRGTESAELIEKRLNSALGEIKCADEYDYIIINDTISVAAENILSVINSDSFKTYRQKNIIDEVLEKC